ncbi:MAG TPA: translation initiation factor IF-2 [Anaeromyxobacter sp.]|nr:translation initiation factor IF-2 [Anaeromyxobacter sp.]
MARKNRPGAAREAVGREAAALRRGAPGGKRYVGERGGQARAARRAQAERVVKMAEQAADERRAEERASASLAGLAVSVIVESFRLAGVLVLAPVRILNALRRAPRAEGEA